MQTRKISELTPYENNARTHSPEQITEIARSITEFGFNNPVLIDEKNNVIAGHGRILAAGELGLDNVPVMVLGHLTDTKKRAYILADNRIALNAGWSPELLKLEFDSLVEDGFDLTLTGFTKDEIETFSHPIPMAEIESEKEKDHDEDNFIMCPACRHIFSMSEAKDGRETRTRTPEMDTARS